MITKTPGAGREHTRREIECQPKAIKVTTVKAAQPALAKDTSPADAVDPKKGNVKPPPLSGVVDEETVRGILRASVEELACSDDSITAGGSEDSSQESSVEDFSSDEEECESSLEVGASEGDKEQASPWSTPESAEIWDGDVFDKKGDQIDWELDRARKQADRRKQEARARIRLGHDKRSGGGRKNWRARGDGDDDLRGWSVDSDGGKESRRRAGTSTSSGRGGRQGGGTAGRRGTEGGDRSRAGAGAGKGRHEGGFAGRGRGRESGGRGSNHSSGRGRGFDPPPASPARPTPKYKWRTSLADGNGAPAGSDPVSPARTTPKYKWRTSVADGNEAPAEAEGTEQPRQQQQNRGAVTSTTAGAAPQDSGSGGTPADDPGGEIRGFRARFGGGGTGKWSAAEDPE